MHEVKPKSIDGMIGATYADMSASRLPAQTEEPVSATDIRREFPASCEPPVILSEHLRRVEEPTRPTCVNCGHSETSNTCAHCGFDPAIDILNLPTVEEMKGLLDKSTAPIPNVTGDNGNSQGSCSCGYPIMACNGDVGGQRNPDCKRMTVPIPGCGEDKLPGLDRAEKICYDAVSAKVPEDRSYFESIFKKFVDLYLAALKENAILHRSVGAAANDFVQLGLVVPSATPSTKAIGPEYLRASREHFKSAPAWHPGDEQIEANIVDPFYVTNYAELLQAREERDISIEENLRLRKEFTIAVQHSNGWANRAEQAEAMYRCYHCKQSFPEGTEHFGKYEEMPKCIEMPRRGQYGGYHDPYIRIRKDVWKKTEAALALRDEEIVRLKDVLRSCRSNYAGYAITSPNSYDKAVAVVEDFWNHISGVDKKIESELARLRGEKV